MIRRCYFPMLLLAFAGMSLWALAEPTAAELEANRNKLVVLRKQPEQLARLRENLQQYQNLPDARRDALDKLDRALSGLPLEERERLSNVLSHYADWLEQLRQNDPPAYRAIQNAPDGKSRLALIKVRRDGEWISSQPKATRERWEGLDGDGRAKLVLKLRQQERDAHERWVLARRFWPELHAKQPVLPCRLADFPLKVKEYIEYYLWPRLTDDEKKRLTEAEGRWPDYPVALVEIASKRPSALPPARMEDLPTHLTQLPIPIQNRVQPEKKGGGKKKLLGQLQPFVGRPEFASKVVDIGTKKGNVPFEHEFWACNFKALQPPMKDFVENTLKPALKEDKERRKLLDSEGTWPYYPLAIQELSQKYNLTPPWHILPDDKKYKWDLYRPGRARTSGVERARDKKGA